MQDEEDPSREPPDPALLVPANPIQIRKSIISMLFIVFGSAVIGLITLAFSESIYKATIASLSTVLGLTLIVVYYNILRALEFYNPFGLARTARVFLIPFRIVEFMLAKIYLRK